MQPIAGEPTQLPEYGEPEFEGVHRPAQLPVDPEIDGPQQGPVLPGRPGQPPPRPRIPVVSALDLGDRARPPEGGPQEPGCYVIVVADGEEPKALGWLQGASPLPRLHRQQPATPPERLGGHWVPVECDPEHFADSEERGRRHLDWAFVFEIGADWGGVRERAGEAAGSRSIPRPGQPAGH
jgi:hypothetical protein